MKLRKHKLFKYKMKIGIYTRKHDSKLPTIDWLIKNDFNSFKVYEEEIINEYDDITEREQLNTLIYNAKEGNIQAVYVEELTVFSKITVKLLQCIIALQEINLPIFYNKGCILPSDEEIKKFKNQMINQWDKITKESVKFKDLDD